MAKKSDGTGKTPGAQFFDQMSEFMEDLSTIRALAEKLASKMGEMGKAEDRNGKPDA